MNHLVKLLGLVLLILLAFSCKKDDETTTPPLPDGLVLAENTIILKSEQNDKLTSVSLTEVIFTQGDAVVDAFKVGDIIVSGVSDFTPNGLLRRVTSVNKTSNEVILGTVQASLTEAIKECDLKFEKTISPDDFRDYTIEVDIGLDDDIPVTGNVKIKPDLLFELSIKNFQVENAIIGFEADYEAAIDVEVVSTGNHGDEDDILEKDLDPITVLIGGLFPLIITPDLELIVGLVYGGPSLHAKVRTTGDIDFYIEKDETGWNKYNDITNDSENYGLSGNFETGFEVYLKPALELEFYDRDEVETLLYVKKSIEGESSYNATEGFQCEMYFSASFGAQMDVDILGFEANPNFNVKVLKFDPFYECPESGLTEDVDEFIPDSILNIITDELDIPINEGLNPPSIEGAFLVSPNVMLSTNIPNDGFDIGHTFDDAIITFSNQNLQDLTVQVSEVQGGGSGDGEGSYIVGEGNKFSVFTELNVYSENSGNRTLARVYSGEISQNGIIDFHCAILMLDDNGDPNNNLIEIGEGRGFMDSDGFSPRQ